MKRLSEGELSELHAQLTDLLDRGWIQHSTAGHAAAVVFARKPDGSWLICYDYRGLNAITRPALSCCRAARRHAGVKLLYKARPRQQLSPAAGADLGPVEDELPVATGPVRVDGECTRQSPRDDCLVHSPTLEQHLLDVTEVLKIFSLQLYAKSSKCEFGRQELGFLGHRLSTAGVSVDPHKVQSIVEWATPTSCTEVRRFTGLANYFRQFVEGYSEVAAPLTALGSPTARIARTPEAQASFDALKLAFSSAALSSGAVHI